MREICRKARANGRRIGLVPTMGALHEGHFSLIRRTKELADISVVSIFVNPAQFGPGEDLTQYPRNLARDIDLCVAEEVDYVFAPPVADIYPPGAQTVVEVRDLSGILEGASRPGHFRGVATVVLKLFEIVGPHVAAFGQKDYQQAVIIRRMVRDLMLDVEILVLPIVRDADEVALSSRNKKLPGDSRRAAQAIPRALDAALEVVRNGQRQADKIVAAARKILDSADSVRIDYVAVVDPVKLLPIEQLDREAVLLVAAYVGEVRLIDNAILRLEDEAASDP
jgi:pantoate--beta-alanine ligase